MYCLSSWNSIYSCPFLSKGIEQKADMLCKHAYNNIHAIIVKVVGTLKQIIVEYKVKIALVRPVN